MYLELQWDDHLQEIVGANAAELWETDIYKKLDDPKSFVFSQLEQGCCCSNNNLWFWGQIQTLYPEHYTRFW
jgi:hypothetical protein